MGSAKDQFIANVSTLVAADSSVEGETHASEHENGGNDEISVTGLSGLLADPQTKLGANLEIAEDAACAILSTTEAIELASSTSGAKAITTTSYRAGQVIAIGLVAATGGSYTLAVTGGALTFDAAGEFAIVMRNAANDGWKALFLSGATVV